MDTQEKKIENTHKPTHHKPQSIKRPQLPNKRKSTFPQISKFASHPRNKRATTHAKTSHDPRREIASHGFRLFRTPFQNTSPYTKTTRFSPKSYTGVCHTVCVHAEFATLCKRRRRQRPNYACRTHNASLTISGGNTFQIIAKAKSLCGLVPTKLGNQLGPNNNLLNSNGSRGNGRSRPLFAREEVFSIRRRFVWAFATFQVCNVDLFLFGSDVLCGLKVFEDLLIVCEFEKLFVSEYK